MEAPTYKIFVINMARSVRRWERISTQLNRLGLPYERVEGVDISTHSRGVIDYYFSRKKNKREYPRPLSFGEIGCYISHVKCWEKIEQQHIDFGVILEDDIVLSDRFPAALKFLQKKYSMWNFVRIQIETKTRVLYQEQSFSDFSFHEYIRTSGCTWGYALNLKTAQKLRRVLIPFGLPVDANTHLYYRYGIDVLTLLAPVVYSNEETSSSEIDYNGNDRRVHNFYPFARQFFQLKSYIGKINYLRKRDGLFVFLKRIFKLKRISPLPHI